MAYKFKPRKSIAKRFRVTATGKLKHERTLRRHLLSARSGDKKREMARAAIMSETHAGNFRQAMGITRNPKRIAHERRVNAQKDADQAATA